MSPTDVNGDGTAARGAGSGAEAQYKNDLNKNYSVISGEEIPIVPVEENDDQVVTQAAQANISIAYYP